MPRDLPVLINRSSALARALGERLIDRVEDAFVLAGRRVVVELVEPHELADALRRHAGEPVVAVGGGDGSIGTAAAILSGTSTALAVLPLGARNRLAAHFGIPCDIEAAARVAASGQRRRTDLLRAGKRIFVDHASFGLYTRLLREREESGHRVPGALRAAWNMLRHMRAQFFAVRLDGRPGEIATPLLTIGTSEQAGERLAGERGLPVESRLRLQAMRDKRPFEMMRLALRALLRRSEPRCDFVEHGRASELVIEGIGAIEGTFDGEPLVLPLPLHITIMPNALGVVTPRQLASPERTLTHIC